MTYDEAKTKAARIKEFATYRYRNDLMFRRVVESAVHMVRGEDEERGREWTRSVHEGAVDAAARALAIVQCDDAMIRHLEAERDAYKARCEEFLSMTVAPLTMPTSIFESPLTD